MHLMRQQSIVFEPSASSLTIESNYGSKNRSHILLDERSFTMITVNLNRVVG